MVSCGVSTTTRGRTSPTVRQPKSRSTFGGTTTSLRRTVEDRLARNVDLTATIAEAANVEMSWSEGRSLFSSYQRLGFVIEASAQFGPHPLPALYCGWRTLNPRTCAIERGEEGLDLHSKHP